jgi:hypothetical protein
LHLLLHLLLHRGATPLVFSERHHRVEIGFCQAFELVRQTLHGTSQMGLTRLQFLRRPLAPTGSL